jgi:hypothetical protein
MRSGSGFRVLEILGKPHHGEVGHEALHHAEHAARPQEGRRGGPVVRAGQILHATSWDAVSLKKRGFKMRVIDAMKQSDGSACISRHPAMPPTMTWRTISTLNPKP